MKKILIVVFTTTTLLLTSCGQSSQTTQELFAESIQKGAEAQEITLSSETASCVAEKALLLIQDEKVLKEKITADKNYELDEPGLMKNEDLEKYSAITLRCLDNEELAAASTVDIAELDCYIKEAGGREDYLDILITDDIVGLAELGTACKGEIDLNS